MRLSLKEIETRVQNVAGRQEFDRDFIFDFLLAYGRSKGNVTRLRSTSASTFNVAEDPNTEVAQKNVLFFKESLKSSEEELLVQVEKLSTSPVVVRYNTRFVIVTDYAFLLARDVKTGETLSTPIHEIADHFTFFLPWAGMEKAQFTGEAHADVKAAERMAKLFDELSKLNPDADQTQAGRNSLNIFFARLLFCFFAEDTGIFEDGQFSQAIASLTQMDGSDVHELLGDIFVALDTEHPADKPHYLADFPYVNGHLFTVKADQKVPRFNKKARDYLLDSGKLIWSEINPDIFGSMFQTIVSPGQRSDLGQHYTSVPNILKTIEPLFLDDLKAEFDAAFNSEERLTALLHRVSQIKVFDPACGSGNFLVIAYKEIRKLEHAILERVGQLKESQQVFDSAINIENFFGIEIDHFAVEVAILSLWIAKHQMNVEFEQKFGTTISLIPLQEMGQVRRGNAARMEWDAVCANDGDSEIYLIGNPPYVGSSMQSKAQKEDLALAYGEREFSKNLDYISIWFIKGADYLHQSQAELAFVTTNSVTQGEHVGLLFPLIFGMGIEIGYAYSSFKWENNAKRNAGVTVAVINLRNEQRRKKYIFVDDIKTAASNINGYLADAPTVFISRKSKTISPVLPRMTRGSQASDDGWLVVDPYLKTELEATTPYESGWLKEYIGSAEFINDKERYCLWIEDHEVEAASNNPIISKRFERISEWRSSRKDKATRDFAATPWKFKQPAYKPTDSIVVPSTSSARREYIPIGYLDKRSVISNSAYAVYEAEPWVFSLLTSRMHMVWTRAVAGRMKTDYRYTNTIVYNNFPGPELSNRSKDALTEAAFRVLDVREYHSERTLAELYDPEKMPENLLRAHQELDELVDSLYRKRAFENDEDRLSLLFGLYSKLSDVEAK